jgi:hypothetical protein
MSGRYRRSRALQSAETRENELQVVSSIFGLGVVAIG